MSIYDAIMKAADSIEQNPGLFDFDTILTPDAGCGTPGCAIGWIAHHLGTTEAHWTHLHTFELLRDALGLSDELSRFDSAAFYERMHSLNAGDWVRSPVICATALRAYAKKYHSEDKPKGIPREVLAIFDEVAA